MRLEGGYTFRKRKWDRVYQEKMPGGGKGRVRRSGESRNGVLEKVLSVSKI